MADNPGATVVDELVVKLGLDATDYKKADREIGQTVDKTERKLNDAAKAETQRDTARKKRLEASKKQMKEYGESVTKMTGVIGALLGVGGGAAGFIGMLAALSSTESAMRRATVATGMSVRQLNAWRGTMQAVTGDAEGGANAVTGLARELTTGRLTGNMPTVQALARVGVGYNTGESIESFLGRAQQQYRASSVGQQANIESVLAASGADANIISLLKSKQNVGDVFGQKYASSAEMNDAGVDAFNSAVADFKNNLRNTATTLMSVVTPAIQAFGDWMTRVNPIAAEFADSVKAAGGGIDGLVATVDKQAPTLGRVLHDIVDGLTVFGQVIDVATFGLEVLGKAIGAVYDWINDHLGRLLGLKDSKTGGGNALDRAGDYLKRWWNDTVSVARTYGPAPVAAVTGASTYPNGVRLTPSAARRVAGLGAGSATSAPGAKITTDVHQFMSQAIAYGFTPAQAAAIAANGQRESNLGTNFGNNGAHGLLQWRGPRLAAFRKQFGIDPNGATLNQVLQFITTDPEERRSLRAAFAGNGSAQALGTGFSAKFERHGSAAEDAVRGNLAQRYYDQYMQANGGAVPAAIAAQPPQFNLNGPITVQANNPGEFANGIQRSAGVQSYSSGVR